MPTGQPDPRPAQANPSSLPGRRRTTFDCEKILIWFCYFDHMPCDDFRQHNASINVSPCTTVLTSHCRCPLLLRSRRKIGDCGRNNMNEHNITTLRALLLADYTDLDRRLTRRLGSADAASDVLH